MAKTIDLVVNSNGVTVLNQTTVAAEETAEAVKSLNQQYTALKKQQEQYQPNTKEFKELTDQMVKLKNQMKESADAVVQNIQPAIENLRSSFGSMGEQIMNLDFKGLSESLNVVSGNLSRLKPADISKGLKSMAEAGVNAFKAIGKAIIANPLLAVAGVLTAIVVNFEKWIHLFPSLENALTGIDQKQRDVAKSAQATADASKKAYENSSLQENSLRLQGKSEKEILQIKMAGLEAAIRTGKVNLQIQEQQAKSQIAAGVRNADLLQKTINGALQVSTLGLRLMAAPIDLLLGAANTISETLGFGTITAVNLNEEISKLTELGSKMASEFLIDPVAQEKELKDSLDKQRQELAQMTSDYQGFQLSIKKMDDDAAKQRKADEEKAQAERERLQKEADANEMERRKKLNDEMMAEDERMASIGLDDLTSREKKKTDVKLLAEMEGHSKLTALKAQNSKETLKKDEEAFNTRLQLASSGLDALVALNEAFTKKGQQQSKKQFQIQKTLNLASAVIDTYGGINRALNDKTMPSTTARIIQASIVGAMGLANVLKISKTEYGNASAPSGTNMSAGGGDSGTSAPSPANFAFLQNQPNQQPPLQAYVVSSQVSSNLEAQQLIQNQSKLGG